MAFFNGLLKDVGSGGLRQPHPGARIHRCGCSLPGLTRFTAYRREGTDGGHHDAAQFNSIRQAFHDSYRRIVVYLPDPAMNQRFDARWVIRQQPVGHCLGLGQ